jgi:predicted cupin superfamily sugar epimerase
MLTAERIIELLQLEPLPREGGYFRETYRAPETIAAALPPRYPAPKSFGSAIYYFLHHENFSALHRLPTDEIYHFYLGDPVEMLLLYADGRSQVITLGGDLEVGQRVQFVAPRGVWQGSQLHAGGQLALLGTTMAPAFDPSDFELGEREALIRMYPERADLIQRLTRIRN